MFAWQRSHGWPTGGFFKLGEYHVDPDAAYNAAQLKGHFHAGYWFVRDTGCQHEGDQIVSTAKSLGVHFVWNDVEVSEARGYSACLLAIERGAGLAAGVYTGPGTWTGDSLPGSTPLWDAAYNYHGPEFDGLWRNTADCWQFTDGKYADRTNVPGIGYDDVNVDSGCIKLVNGGTGVKLPVGFRYLDRTVRQFGHVKAQERHTVYVWYAHACKQPVRRLICKSTSFHGQLLRARLIKVARSQPAGWGLFHRVRRNQILAVLAP